MRELAWMLVRFAWAAAVWYPLHDAYGGNAILVIFVIAIFYLVALADGVAHA